MNSPKPMHDTTWIKAWITLGCLVVLAGLMLPIALFTYAAKDITRYHECAGGVRKDCDPSILWSVYEQALDENGGAGLKIGSSYESYMTLGDNQMLENRSKELVRTSDKAALITQAELKDMTLANGWYRAKGGTKIDVTTTIDGKPDKVAIYLSDKNPDQEMPSRKVSDMKLGTDGTYTGQFTVNKGLLGELEIRATGPGKESASLYFNVAAE